MKKQSRKKNKKKRKKKDSILLPFFMEGQIEAGCDEAGRGCLAGPVFAAAVILPPGFRNSLLTDSKQLSSEERAQLRPIIEKEALAWAVEMVNNIEIDNINILNASFLAMNKAINKLKIVPEHLLIDGHMFRSQVNIPHTCIVKGDGKYMAIAAASVLAKTWRDNYMEKIHLEHPYYCWDKNKGYPTLQHRNAITSYGISPYHRLSFKHAGVQLELDL